MRKLQSLRIKVPFFVMCLMFIIVTILVSLTINIGAKGIRNSSIFGLESTTRVYSRMINAWLKQSMIIADSIASGFVDIRNHLALNTEETGAIAGAVLRNIVANNEEVEVAVIFDRAGNPILDSIGGRFVNSSSNIDLIGTELWTRVLSGETSMYHTLLPSPLGDNKWLIEIFSPVRNSLGNIIGVVSVMVDWHSFIDEELNSVKFGNTGHPFIVDRERTVIADTEISNIRNKIIQDADYIKYVRENESGYYEFESPLNGKKSVATFNREPISDWSVVMSVESEELFSDIYSMIKYAVIGVVIILLIADVVIYLYMGTIIKILKLLSLDLDRLAQGDLTWRVPSVLLTRKDEFGTIACSVERILDVLNEKVQVVYNSADTVKSSAEEVAQGNIDLSERTENQASGLEETASSMEQIASTIKSSADHTVSGNNMMINSRSAVEDAGRIIEETTKNIEAVFESSSKISAITKIIESIAFQTNILALNAAVEAARAGEQGRGFAVVASEVRNLAQTTQASVKDITALVSDSEEKIATATETARESKDIFNNLKHQIEETAKIMQDLSSTAMEQQAGVNQVNIAIAQMDMATQQNAALVEESTAASQTLFSQAKELLNAMEFFRLREEEYNNSKKNTAENNGEKNKIENLKSTESYKLESSKKDEIENIKEDFNFNKEDKIEDKKEFTENKADVRKPSSELKSPIKSPLDIDKNKYEKSKPMPSVSKDKEFGATFDNSQANDEGFESF